MLFARDGAEFRHDVRVGGGHLATIEPATAGATTTLDPVGEVTPRYFAPQVEILISSRYRFEARWKYDDGTSFSYRLRARIQLEREFTLSHQYGIALTPFANTITNIGGIQAITLSVFRFRPWNR